jgi:fibronectin type 3 domain-containing protein/predicted small lipoprotein YifL
MSYDLMGRGWMARSIARAAGPGMKAFPALAAAALVAALALAACGKEGPPTPPLRAVPAPAKDLAVRQRGTHMLLSFTYPQTTPGGAALNGVTKVEVYEAVLLPPPPPKAQTKPADKKPAAGKGAAATTPAAGSAGTATAGAATTPGVATAPGAATTPGAAPAATTAGTASTSATGAPATAAAGGTAGKSGATGTVGAAGANPTSPGAAGAPATPSPLDPRLFENLAKLRVTLTSKELGAATLGNQLIIDLALPEPLPAATVTAPAAVPGAAPAKAPAGTTTATATAGAASAAAAAGPTRDYAVRTYGPQGDRSAFSNQALLLPKAPPPPPAGVTVTPQADGILAAWKPVPNAGGYAVYRRAATERFSSKPLALVGAGETRHLDQTARFGQSYIYSVTAVDPKSSLVESAIKVEQEIHYVDVYPPPVPEDLVAVAEASRARLVWRQSEAPDLAGYIVYRKGATGDFVRLTAKPIAAANYVDTAVVSGQAYDYRVTAIDQTGNESAPSAEVHVAVP